MRNISYAVLSDTGLIRTNNEDNFFVGSVINTDPTVSPVAFYGDYNTDLPFFMGVFDGMGGADCGEDASRIAAETASMTDFSTDGQSALMLFARTANRRICEFAAENRLKNTGTTGAALLFKDKGALMFNIGDSRVYKLSKDGFFRLSVDDYAFALPGRKPPLSQCLGIPESEMIIVPHIIPLNVRAGDRYLICSDGLSDMVPEIDIATVLGSGEPTDVVSALTDKALSAGGRDNITIACAVIRR